MRQDIKRKLRADFFDEEYWERGGGDKAGYAGLRTLEGMNRDMAAQFTSAFGWTKNTKVLDLGCGGGHFVRYVLDLGVDIYGIDISEYAIKKSWELYGLKGRTFVGSIHDLGQWPDSSFDFLYSQQAFEHLSEEFVPDLVRECFRVHKPGGQMWVGLVLRECFMPENAKTEDRDPTHVTIKHKEWWDDQFRAVDYRLYPDLEIKMMETPMWKSLRWHQLAYYKPMERE